MDGSFRNFGLCLASLVREFCSFSIVTKAFVLDIPVDSTLAASFLPFRVSFVAKDLEFTCPLVA